MSLLKSKNILMVGEENAQTKALEHVLQTYKMSVKKTSCDSLNKELIEDSKIDLIFVNYSREGTQCRESLSLLKNTSLTSVVPIFMLTKDDEKNIQEVLNLGATDYITPNESSESVVQKINAVLSASDNFGGSTDIDISPIEASISSTGIRVYVVEDDPLLRNLLSIRFDASSFPYEFSTDGKLVVPAMLQFKPDIIILDLMLPGKSGFDVLEEVKADDSLKGIPVIVFSNKDGQEDRKRASDLGAVGFYVKAMTDLSELVETIETLTKVE